MQPLPLISHDSPDAVVAYRDGSAIPACRFLADVRRVASILPEGRRHMLNLCQDRYRFAVALAASLLTGRVNLLPTTATPEVLGQMAAFAPDSFCLVDRDGCAGPLPVLPYPEGDEAGVDTGAVPQIEPDRLVAYVFTSGSTGIPMPHPKHWGPLVRNVRAEAQRLGLSDRRSFAIVATVPSQHMYGFETAVLLPLQSGSALLAGRPFYPADICSALASMPEPRILVTTPVHLRALLASGLESPELDLVISATAPLSDSLSQAVETSLRTRILEIYGCTETGQIATRFPTRGPEWRLYPGVRLETQGDQTWAEGGHVEGRVPLGDLIERTGDDRFLLRGRTADLVNIAGKRSSLAYLNQVLGAVPGVRDGVFFMPRREGADAVARLAALVVAPGLDAPTLMAELRLRIDPAFLPRPLVLVERLPRNATGKLPRQALEALIPGPGRAAPCRESRAEGTPRPPLPVGEARGEGNDPGDRDYHPQGWRGRHDR
jgi:acyl-coenzyme A synthetase/AMP-(fatty) acid ligase